MRRALTVTVAAAALLPAAEARAQTVVDPKLEVVPLATGLTQPLQVEFIDEDAFFVSEKASGQVKLFEQGKDPRVVLDLTVNSSSERGLLGMALDRFFRHNGLVYLYWSETTQAVDNSAGDAVPLMGNRLDQFKWDGTNLVYVKTLFRGRALQDDLTNRTNPANPVFRGNHNGGVVRVGPDGKVYLQIGDTGRRGQTQNLFDGPFGEGIPDDQFGGPDITNEHLTGVILRLNPDGSAPRDNPFWKVGAERGGQVGANLKKIYAYGLRNGFGMAFDPFSGDLWEQENGDDSFSEINRTFPGFNSGWTQVMGPLDRVAQYKAIETNRGPTGDPAANSYYGLQQNRWLPERIADNPRDAERALFKLPGSRFSDPEMAWKYEFAPGGIGFISDRTLGKDYKGDMFIGSASFRGGNLFHLPIHNNRRTIDPDDKRLRDGVADNLRKYDLTESETLLFGSGFGVTPEVEESPRGSLIVASSSLGTVFEIRRRDK
jgi:glucose/arabinose dehydrogenase